MFPAGQTFEEALMAVELIVFRFGEVLKKL